MKKRARRWVVWSGLVGGMLAGSAASVGYAQQPAPAAQSVREGPTTKTYTSKTNFTLPVKIDDRLRANLREVNLYVKINQGDWVRQETGLPTQELFTYRALQDGEYWFRLVTVDKQGKSSPADLNLEPPNLKVVVDTRAPIIELQPFTNPEGELFIRCQVQDANPDQQNVKITYRGADQAERALEAVVGQVGLFRVSGPEIWGVNLKAVAVDRCGNANARDFTLREVVAAAGLPVPPQLANLPPTQANTSYKMGGPGVTPAGFRPDGPPALPGPEPRSTPPASPQTPPMFTANSMPPPVPGVPTPKTDISDPKNMFPGPTGAASNRQLLNTTHAALEYRIDQVGPSGVSKVEIWITSDQGTTWTRLCDDSDKRSPAEITLPGEGLFGLRLVVTNGNGFGGTPPQRGDQPTSWLEVDSTMPHVQLRTVEPVTNGGTLELRWTASDKNLQSEPVTLYYAQRRDGPWQLIARNVKNEGSYRWAFPREVGGQFFIRVEVVDQAGNVGRAETTAPIVLDMTEPRAQVIGVTGIATRPAPMP